MTEPDVKATTERYFDAIENADAEDFTTLFTDDVVFEDPVGGPRLEGHAGMARFHKGLRRAWSNLRMEATAIHARGERAAVAWRAQGASTSGKAIDFEGINVFELAEDGRIRRMQGFWDLEGVIGRM